MKPFPRVRWLVVNARWLMAFVVHPHAGRLGQRYCGDVMAETNGYLAESTEAPEERFPRRWMAKRFIERAAAEAWYRDQMRVAEMNQEERMQYDQEQEQLQAVRDEVVKHFGGVK